jgi:hypothetical protein
MKSSSVIYHLSSLPLRYDDHQNLFYDESTGEYVLTTRDYTSTRCSVQQ